MLIRTDDKTGRSLVDSFEDREKDILAYMDENESNYFASECFKKLRNRMARLDDSVDMRFHPNRSRTRAANDFKSKIAMPLVREKQRVLQGLTLASFRNDPLVTVLPDGDTPRANADKAQQLLNQNFRRTQFREKAWRRAIAYASRYGTAVMTYAYRETQQMGAEKTQMTPFGLQKLPMKSKSYHNVFNRCVNPLNYFQNPHVTDPDDSDFRGWIERIPLSELIKEMKTGENYIEKNLKEVIDKAMKSTINDPSYFAKGSSAAWFKVGVDVRYWYGRVNIEGYEDDDTIYYAERIGDKIIRFGTNHNDENIVPIQVFGYDPRLEYWWHNSPIENSMPMENFLNLILGMRADQAIKTVERFLFFDSSTGIDPSDLNNRLHNGGYIKFDGKGRPVNEIFYEYQPRDFSANSIQPIIQEIKEADQRVSFDSDFHRAPQQGGPQNETATAAIMMDEKGNVLKSDLLEMFSYGLTGTARGNLVILQEMLPEYFMIGQNRGPTMEIHKSEVLGYYQYEIRSSLTKNKVTQLTNLINFLTAVQNFRGTGDPAYMAIQLPSIIRSWIQKYDLDLDIDEVYPQQLPQPLPVGGPAGQITGGPMQPSQMQQQPAMMGMEAMG